MKTVKAYLLTQIAEAAASLALSAEHAAKMHPHDDGAQGCMDNIMSDGIELAQAVKIATDNGVILRVPENTARAVVDDYNKDYVAAFLKALATGEIDTNGAAGGLVVA